MRAVKLVLSFVMIFLLGAPHLEAKRVTKSKNRSIHRASSATPKTHSKKPATHSVSKTRFGKSSRNKGRKTARPRRPRGQLTPDAERTREIQEKLIDSGALSGPPNGVWDGKRMGEAIKKFQQMKGLNATGKLDVPTLKAMGLKS